MPNRILSVNFQKLSILVNISKETDFLQWQAKLRVGDIKTLSQSITLIESTREVDQSNINKMCSWLMKQVGRAHRIAVTGAPGVGKSTFIESLGMCWVDRGHKVAILAIDPTSQITHGSVLGDKTRMTKLIANENVFIRPSPSSNQLGGVSNRTLEVAWLCEVAGFDRIIIETVGVGQSEITVKEMVDCFLVLTQPQTGDFLQGIKKGLMEQADCILVNKSDVSSEIEIKNTVDLWKQSIMMTRGGKEVPVESISALKGAQIKKAAELIDTLLKTLVNQNQLEEIRQNQLEKWISKRVKQDILNRLEVFLNDDSTYLSSRKDVVVGIKSMDELVDEIIDGFTQKLK